MVLLSLCVNERLCGSKDADGSFSFCCSGCILWGFVCCGFVLFVFFPFRLLRSQCSLYVYIYFLLLMEMLHHFNVHVHITWWCFFLAKFNGIDIRPMRLFFAYARTVGSLAVWNATRQLSRIIIMILFFQPIRTNPQIGSTIVCLHHIGFFSHLYIRCYCLFDVLCAWLCIMLFSYENTYMSNSWYAKFACTGMAGSIVEVYYRLVCFTIMSFLVCLIARYLRSQFSWIMCVCRALSFYFLLLSQQNNSFRSQIRFLSLFAFIWRKKATKRYDNFSVSF